MIFSRPLQGIGRSRARQSFAGAPSPGRSSALAWNILSGFGTNDTLFGGFRRRTSVRKLPDDPVGAGPRGLGQPPGERDDPARRVLPSKASLDDRRPRRVSSRAIVAPNID